MSAPELVTVAEGEYHADPALSRSGAKLILRSPKHFREAPRRVKRAFDFGHAAHKEILGEGAEVVEIPADILASNGAASTKEARAFIADARAAGKTPIKAEEMAVVRTMAKALSDAPEVAGILARDGVAEQSVWWTDERTGVRCRARFDWLTSTRDGRPVIVDYKSCINASPRAFARSVVDYGYDMQDAFYSDGLMAALGVDEPPLFVFVAQEKDAPYVAAAHQLSPDFKARGVELAHRARETYAKCLATDTWPAYGAQIHTLDLPRWATDNLTQGDSYGH